MSDGARFCTICPPLRVQVAEQQRTIYYLTRQVEMLREALAALGGGVVNTSEFLDRELERPSLPRYKLMPLVSQRLEFLVEQLEGMR